MKIKLQEALDRYRDSKLEFNPYYKGVNKIVCSPLFVEQLDEILAVLDDTQQGSAKSFKMYLDAVIMNMETKVAKYKQSHYFDDAAIKEIENQGYLIPFYTDDDTQVYVLLGIIKK